MFGSYHQRSFGTPDPSRPYRQFTFVDGGSAGGPLFEYGRPERPNVDVGQIHVRSSHPHNRTSDYPEWDFFRPTHPMDRPTAASMLKEKQSKDVSELNMSQRLRHETDIQKLKTLIKSMPEDSRVGKMYDLLYNRFGDSSDLAQMRKNLDEASDADLDRMSSLCSTEAGMETVRTISQVEYD
jgi:hypothetical protein